MPVLHEPITRRREGSDKVIWPQQKKAAILQGGSLKLCTMYIIFNILANYVSNINGKRATVICLTALPAC
jgi:hypothetical protein